MAGSSRALRPRWVILFATAFSVLVTGPALATDSRYAPNASPQLVATLNARCHVSITCPLSSGDYAIYRRAMAGDHEAEAAMGRKLDRGEGVPADRDAAAIWYGRSAEGGFVRAALELNRLYRAGVPLHSDDRQIAAQMKRGVDAGDSDAMRALADMFFYGRGMPRDATQAMNLLRHAAASGSKAATEDLARLQQPGGPGGPR